MKVITILNNRRDVLTRKIKSMECELLQVKGIATDENMKTIVGRVQALEADIKVAKMALVNLDKELEEKALNYIKGELEKAQPELAKY